MDSFMALGFVTGMRHALDADHVAAVVSLGAQRTGVRSNRRFGICWGIGHALALLSIGAVVLSGNIRLPAIWTSAFESAVGAMLFVLGVDLLRRLLRDQLRPRPISPVPIAVGHRSSACIASPCAASSSEAGRRVHGAALLVGLIHGMAGSAALALLAASMTASPGLGFGYLALFGAGSIGGMALLSWALAVPHRYIALRKARAQFGVTALIAVLTVALGLRMLLEHAR